MGVYTLALTYLSFFYLVENLGLNAHILAGLKKGRNQLNQLYSFRIIWSFVLEIIAVLILILIPSVDLHFFNAVVLGLGTITLSGIMNTAMVIFQSRLKLEKQTLALSIGALVAIFVTFGLILLRVEIEYMVLATLLDLVVGAGVAFYLAKKTDEISFLWPDLSRYFRATSTTVGANGLGPLIGLPCSVIIIVLELAS